MYKVKEPNKSKIEINESYNGETIEQKVRRIINNKEPITDGAPLIYTERKDGIQPEYDVRTDRFELAVEAMDKVSKTHTARREERNKPKETKKDDKKADNGDKTDGATPANTSDTVK